MRIYEIAKLAGVSITTVSWVINKNRGVRPDKKRRVLEVIRTHNYKPDPYAHYLAFRRNGNSSGRAR